MNGSLSLPSSTWQRIGWAALASGVLCTAGCSNLATTASSTALQGTGGSITGRLHGGSQPVAFATVKLWYAGQGVPSPASVGATTTTANDGAGSFSFNRNPVNGQPGVGNTYSCPLSDPLVYVIASGGNTLNSGDPAVNNDASVFIAPFGQCSTISASSFVNMTEVTTVATMAALQQYFNPLTAATPSNPVPESFSTDGSGLAKSAMINAFATIRNLVDLSSGTAITSRIIPAGSITAGVGYAGTSVTAIPESTKINLMANILASCINTTTSSASVCTTLFSNALPPDPVITSRPYPTVFPMATDVLQAAYYMLTNPTSGSTANLTNLFDLSPAVGAPFQPVLTSAPSDWTVAISYSSSSTCGANGGHLIQSAKDLAIDIYGGVWLANFEAGVGNLTQLGPTGVPATCIAVGSGSNTGVTIDTASGLNNVWVADSASSNVYRYKPGTSNVLAFPTAVSPAVNLPGAIAADGTGNIYFTSPSNAALYEIPGGAAASAAVSPVSVATTIGSDPARITVDGTEAVWTTSGSNFITRTTSSTPNAGTGFSSLQLSALTPTYGLSVTATFGSPSKNYVFTSQQGSSNSLFLQTGSGTSYTSVGGWPVTGLSTPTAVVSDGARNVWTLNNANGANSLFATGISQQSISPATGFVKSASYLGGGRSMVIDQSGNLWIGLDGTNSITEIVGAAVPVTQPYATAIARGTFQQIP